MSPIVSMDRPERPVDSFDDTFALSDGARSFGGISPRPPQQSNISLPLITDPVRENTLETSTKPYSEEFEEHVETKISPSSVVPPVVTTTSETSLSKLLPNTMKILQESQMTSKEFQFDMDLPSKSAMEAGSVTSIAESVIRTNESFTLIATDTLRVTPPMGELFNSTSEVLAAPASHENLERVDRDFVPSRVVPSGVPTSIESSLFKLLPDTKRILHESQTPYNELHPDEILERPSETLTEARSITYITESAISTSASSQLVDSSHRSETDREIIHYNTENSRSENANSGNSMSSTVMRPSSVALGFYPHHPTDYRDPRSSIQSTMRDQTPPISQSSVSVEALDSLTNPSPVTNVNALNPPEGIDSSSIGPAFSLTRVTRMENFPLRRLLNNDNLREQSMQTVSITREQKFPLNFQLSTSLETAESSVVMSRSKYPSGKRFATSRSPQYSTDLENEGVAFFPTVTVPLTMVPTIVNDINISIFPNQITRSKLKFAVQSITLTEYSKPPQETSILQTVLVDRGQGQSYGQQIAIPKFSLDQSLKTQIHHTSVQPENSAFGHTQETISVSISITPNVDGNLITESPLGLSLTSDVVSFQTAAPGKIKSFLFLGIDNTSLSPRSTIPSVNNEDILDPKYSNNLAQPNPRTQGKYYRNFHKQNYPREIEPSLLYKSIQESANLTPTKTSVLDGSMTPDSTALVSTDFPLAKTFRGYTSQSTTSVLTFSADDRLLSPSNLRTEYYPSFAQNKATLSMTTLTKQTSAPISPKSEASNANRSPRASHRENADVVVDDMNTSQLHEVETKGSQRPSHIPSESHSNDANEGLVRMKDSDIDRIALTSISSKQGQGKSLSTPSPSIQSKDDQRHDIIVSQNTGSRLKLSSTEKNMDSHHGQITLNESKRTKAQDIQRDLKIVSNDISNAPDPSPSLHKALKPIAISWSHYEEDGKKSQTHSQGQDVKRTLEPKEISTINHKSLIYDSSAVKVASQSLLPSVAILLGLLL
ncbi:hypothetical protein NEOLI_001656 [Neolecta irregularis DAH-3]|uniref:Uncharacterized protein n=1 Tax=Neolecta irregularis (strain DAH-3) TaxID=1198029 RepID=A0A1U7LLV6_NEOID|nr:hypothetical protein NEOLI_001656 [Neolecta irregularis DAH-3]|eukprot:OLL23644.1 hypothetical protein NEOLI_001656 [Neolecta irregularis DAH-3]